MKYYSVSMRCAKCGQYQQFKCLGQLEFTKDDCQAFGYKRALPKVVKKHQAAYGG